MISIFRAHGAPDPTFWLAKKHILFHFFLLCTHLCVPPQLKVKHSLSPNSQSNEVRLLKIHRCTINKISMMNYYTL